MTDHKVYPGIRLQGEPLQVEVFTVEQAQALAPSIVRLIREAYSRQFEGPGKPLPEGVFAATYSDAVVPRFRDEVIPRVFARGGNYLGIRNPDDPDELLAVLKTLPGDAIEEGWFSGMAGIAEVLVDPEAQGNGYGAAVLHAYLNDAPPDQRVMLDAFVGSSVNVWYERLGFVPDRDSGELALGLEHSLPTQYYVSEKDVTTSAMARRLEAAHPELLVPAA